MRDHPSRRQVGAGVVGLGVGLLAGCAGASDDDATGVDETTSPDDAAASGSSPSADSTDTETDAPTTQDSALDLREANVVGVAVERDGDAYDFDVTLHHDDDGEDGYADWWQVERLDGARLGRRELRHAHSQQPFTRSAAVEIPDSVECVVVRGHDQTHGYGGRLAVVDLGSGATNAVDQGAEPQSVDADACPSG